MIKRFFKTCRLTLISLTVAIIVLALTAGYTVGVVSKNDVIARIDTNIGSMETYLEKNHDAAELLTEQFKDEYAAKTRTIALLLAQDVSFITDDRTLEELRVTVNAERISVADKDGSIIASTDPSSEGNTVREEFRSHLSEKVYTDVLFLLDSDEPVIAAASSLEYGMVQITFSEESVVSLLQEADIANTAQDMPLYSSGTTAVIGVDNFTYISCTDGDKIGTKLEYDTDMFRKNKGKFDVRSDEGEKQMLHYQISGDYIIMAVVPYDDINHMRNVVVSWILCGGAIMLVVVCLALRMQFLKTEK